MIGKIKKNNLITGINFILFITVLIVLFFQSTNQNKISANLPQTSQAQGASILVTPYIPIGLKFAGEDVPVDDIFVKEQLEQELVINANMHASTILILKRANRWKAQMLEIMKSYGVPEDFFYLMVAESAVMNAVSPAGAKGYWQFMSTTAREYGLDVNTYVDFRYDPIASTHAACKYLTKSYNRFKNWTIVAASYNMGMGGINGMMTFQKDYNYHNLYLNKETARYVYRIISYKLIFENPVSYGFYLSKSDLYDPIETKTVSVGSINSIVQFAKKYNTTYKTIKLLNPWMLKRSLPANKSGKEYDVLVPV